MTRVLAAITAAASATALSAAPATSFAGPSETARPIASYARALDGSGDEAARAIAFDPAGKVECG